MPLWLLKYLATGLVALHCFCDNLYSPPISPEHESLHDQMAGRRNQQAFRLFRPPPWVSP
jgi:hypothetical protein